MRQLLTRNSVHYTVLLGQLQLNGLPFRKKGWNYRITNFVVIISCEALGTRLRFVQLSPIILPIRGRPNLTQILRDLGFDLNQSWQLFKMNCKQFSTSVPITFVVKSVWVGNKILRSCFFGSVTKLALEERDHPVEALASIVFATNLHACVRKICQHRVVNMSL